jgi:hypothetical protein
MRLWSLHPQYLDPQGLVALWREALLAQAVLRGQTRGYTHHPQLDRFRATAKPAEALAAYLHYIHLEALRRGYQFDARKIGRRRRFDLIAVTQGQLDYEWGHLLSKLERRNPAWMQSLKSIRQPEPHPLLHFIPGEVEKWEVIPPHTTSTGLQAGNDQTR